MSKSSGFVSTIYKTRKVLLELLKNRGYNIEDYSNFNISKINTLIDTEQLDLLLENNDGGKAYVKYYLKSTTNKKTIKDDVGEYFETDTLDNTKDEFIIVMMNEPNDSIQKVIKQLWNFDKIFVSAFSIHRLMFNILEHKMVPPHRIINDVELAEFKNKYNITDEKNELPEISMFDPVAVAIGLRPGQVCEITRNSKTSISTKYYRVCV